MIFVNLKGGLGNQMFQYALGRRLALERGVGLKLSLSSFSEQQERKFELDQFNIPTGLALPEQFYKFPPFSRKGWLEKLFNRLNRYLPESLRFVIVEKRTGHFDAGILRSRGSKYLDGYWQSEKYFRSIQDQIRADFTLKQPLSPQDQMLADEMAANPRSVSVHIRRGDYVSDFRFIRRFLVCTPDYYTEAMRQMLDKLGKGVVFYIFSDDPDWSRTGIDYPSDFRIITDSKRLASHELVLMSHCRNAILTNSSFSWWGAWLKEDPKKIVIYPSIWFYNDSAPDIPLLNWIAFQHNTKNDWKYIDIPFVKSRYQSVIGQELNLESPQRFTEKIQWLKVYDRKPFYQKLADKVAVRDYVAEKVGNQYLTKVFGIYDNCHKIKWKSLPNMFVLKPAHGSNMAICCKNKKGLNKKKACEKLDNWNNKNNYYYEREWQFKDIPPKIICEEFLEGDENLGLMEYKFWCFNGQPKYIELVDDRFGSIKRALFDLDWQKLDVRITYPKIEKEIPRPAKFDEMLEITRTLSVGIPFVRVDLFNFKEKVLFGGMTFSPEGGLQIIQPLDFDYILGQELILPQ